MFIIIACHLMSHLQLHSCIYTHCFNSYFPIKPGLTTGFPCLVVLISSVFMGQYENALYHFEVGSWSSPQSSLVVPPNPH